MERSVCYAKAYLRIVFDEVKDVLIHITVISYNGSSAVLKYHSIWWQFYNLTYISFTINK